MNIDAFYTALIILVAAAVTFGTRTVRVRVLAVPEFATKEQAALLYEEPPAGEE